MIHCSSGSRIPFPKSIRRRIWLGAEGTGASSPAHPGLGQSPDFTPRVGYRLFAQGTNKDGPAPGSRTGQKLSLNISPL